MKHLLYYNQNSQFVTDQTNAGGDGTKVVSVIDGVAWAKDSEKTYYRESLNNLTQYTVTIHYISNDNIIGTQDVTISPDETITYEAYAGITLRVNIPAKEISGYRARKEEEEISLNGDTAITFYYDEIPADNVLRVYYCKDVAGPTRIYYHKYEYGTQGFYGKFSEAYLDGSTTKMSSKPNSAYTLPGNVNSMHRIDYVLNTGTDCPDTVRASEWYGGFWGCSAITKVIIPKQIKYMSATFGGCKNLEEIIFAEHSVESMYSLCFANCSKLKELILPEGLFYFGAGTVWGGNCNQCTSLEKVVFPSTLLILDGYNVQFYNCTSLTEIHCKAINAPNFVRTTVNTFSNIATNGTLYCPKGSDYSKWLGSDSSTGTLAYYGWKVCPVDYKNNDFKELEYIETLTGIQKITTDKKVPFKEKSEFSYLRNHDNYLGFIAVTSFYIPKNDDWSTIVEGNNFIIQPFYDNGLPRLNCVRLSGNTDYDGSKKIFEHTSFDAAQTGKGFNIVARIQSRGSYGYGSYFNAETNLNGPENNYPYNTFDSLMKNQSLLTRCGSNWSRAEDFNSKTIEFFNGTIYPGTRFYGAKIWAETGQDYTSYVTNKQIELLYDFVPAFNRKTGEYGILEKNSQTFVPSTNLIGG